MLGSSGEQPTVIGEQLVGLDPQRGGEVDRIERPDRGPGKLAGRAQQLCTDSHQHAGGKQRVNLLAYLLARVGERRRARNLNHCDTARRQDVITGEVVLEGSAFDFFDDQLDQRG